MRISEHYYSVQGEGITQGIPAYFVRLQGCNLNCTWCDTTEIWRKGNEVTNEELEEEMKNSGQFDNILNGNTHLIWTGGEPTMERNRKSISGFLDYLKNKYPKSSPYSEIETNATIKVENNFYRDYIQQINCSPKLSNSLMRTKDRINPSAIKQILEHDNGWFKFVVSSEKDILEMQENYIKPFKLPKSKIILMPQADSLKSLSKATKICYELTMKYGYRTISRGQILAWNNRNKS